MTPETGGAATRAHVRGRGPSLRDRARERPARGRRDAVHASRSTTSVVWPEPDSPFPPSHAAHALQATAARTSSSARAAPPIRTTRRTASRRTRTDVGRELDALRAIALRMAEGDPDEYPHTVLLLGDQVYADEVSPETLAYIRSQSRHHRAARRGHRRLRGVHAALPRGVDRPADPLAALHRALGDDLRRPRRHRRLEHVAASGSRRCAPPTGGTARVVGGFMSYVLYQHWGNLSPDALEEEEIYRQVRRPATAATLLREYAFKCDREVEGARWSYCRDVGSHAGRDDRLARRPRAHAGQAQHGRRRASGTGSPSTRPAASTTC